MSYKDWIAMAFWAFDKISKAKNFVKKNLGTTLN